MIRIPVPAATPDTSLAVLGSVGLESRMQRPGGAPLWCGLSLLGHSSGRGGPVSLGRLGESGEVCVADGDCVAASGHAVLKES